MLTLKEFKEARAVLSGVILNTSLVYSKAFSRATGNQVYIKPENMQVTGAYKIRGAYYKISTLSEEEKARGLVTASAGNHAQGVAYAAQAAGVEATIVMPTTTPLVKVNNTKDYGAKVILQGETFDDAAALAAQLSIIRAIRHAGLVPCGTFMMGGTVGEEAPGEARGVRALMASQTDLDAYLALEGGHMFDIIPGAVACKRQEIIVTGPGGHSWSDFGLASPINALGRAIARIADLHPVASPKTTYNVGLVSGGTSVNAIAHEARMHVDIRSTDTAERNKLEALIMDQIRLAVDEENAAHPGAPLHLANRPYGDKPGGEMPADHLIVRAALAATEAVGIHACWFPCPNCCLRPAPTPISPSARAYLRYA